MASKILLSFLTLLLTLTPSLYAQITCQTSPRPQISANFGFLSRHYFNYQSGGWVGMSNSVRLSLARKLLLDAQRNGMTFSRLPTTNFQANELQVYDTTPDLYWSTWDTILADFAGRHIKIIPSFFWNYLQYVWYTKDTLHTMLTNSSSTSQLLLYRHVREFITRYKNNPLILFWELGNELNLEADLDIDTRQASVNASNGAPTTGHNFTTDEMITFQTALAAYIRTLDSTRPISSGYAAPRKFAEHLRVQPEWVSGGDFTADSQAQFEKNLSDVHAGIELVSIHLYNNFSNGVSGARENERLGISGITNVELIDIIKTKTDAMKKLLFIGEFGDYSPDPATDPNGLFSQAMIDKIIAKRIPYSLIWVWQFYQTDPWTPIGRSLEPGLTDVINAKLKTANATCGFIAPPLPSPDTEPPNIIFSYPFDGTTLSASQRFHAVASDSHGAITKVEFYDGPTLLQTITTPPYDVTINTTGFSSGPHTLKARAYDSAGNISDSIITVTK